MPGQRFWAPMIEDIDPLNCSVYSNVVIMCGINSVRQRHVRSEQDIENIYIQLKHKIRDIQKINTKCNVYVCPLLPTKDLDLNRRVNCLNNMIFTDLVKTNLGVSRDLRVSPITEAC